MSGAGGQCPVLVGSVRNVPDGCRSYARLFDQDGRSAVRFASTLSVSSAEKEIAR